MPDTPLILIIENAKRDMNNMFYQIINKSGLPAYLIEGIIVDILSEVRNRKNIELSEALVKYSEDVSKKSETTEQKE